MSSKSSTTDPLPQGPVAVGLVHKPHGVRGEVAVESYSDAAGRYAPGSRLTVQVPGVAPREIVVRASRRHGRGLLVAFEGVDDRDRAEELRSGVLTIDPADVEPAPEGEYYHFQLVGCRCSDRTHGELGAVIDVLEDGGGELLLVGDSDGDWLIPFVRDFLVSVDVDRRRIEFDLPEGLLDTCRSGS